MLANEFRSLINDYFQNSLKEYILKIEKQDILKNFESLIDYFEDQIEIRIESLKCQFDEIFNRALKNLDKYI